MILVCPFGFANRAASSTTYTSQFKRAGWIFMEMWRWWFQTRVLNNSYLESDKDTSPCYKLELYYLVWTKYSSLRIHRLACNENRLTTGVRMRIWGQDQPCVLCGEREETRDYLFFAFPFSFNVWSDLAGNLLRQPQDPDWSATVMVLISGSGSYLDDILLKLCFQITIYTIWHERNNRIHNGYHSTMTQVLRRIEKTVRNRITSLDYTKKPRLQRLMQRWFEAGPMLLRKNWSFFV